MDPFWRTVENALPGMGWDLFSAGHLTWLLAGAAACALAGLAYNHMGEYGRRIFRMVLAILIIENLVSDQIFLAVTGQYTLDHIPLHMCCFGGYLIVAHAFMTKKNDMLAGLTYAVSLPGAVLALATPNWSVLPYWNFSGIQSFLYHIMLIMYPIALICGGYRPSFAHIRRTVIPILLCIAAIFGLNKLLGTDFLFINGAKTVPWLHSLTKIFGDIGYIWVFPVTIALLWTIMFLPFYLISRSKTRARSSTVNV